MGFGVLRGGAICLITLLGSQALAQNAPAQLRGRSVVATWTETRLQRLGGMGEFSERSYPHSLSAYISSEGRVFAKRTVFVGGGRRGSTSGSKSSVGEDSGNSQSAQIRGKSLFVMSQFHGGARMVRIDFDPGFSSCTANVILGRENGEGVMRGRSLTTGQTLEIKSAKVSNPSCSVRDGNVFGN